MARVRRRRRLGAPVEIIAPASGTTRHMRLIVPALAPLHQKLGKFAYPMIRVAAGLMLVPYGWSKLFDPPTMTNIVELLHRLKLEPAAPLGWLLGLIELLGGLMLAAGFFTRPVALVIAIEMAVITLDVFVPTGRGYQLTLLWCIVAVAIVFRGGGRYSADQLMGREF
jgi:putative oxidoreductase